MKSKESYDSQIKVSIRAKSVMEDYENQRSVLNFIERVMNNPKNEKEKKYTDLKGHGIKFSDTQKEILTNDSSTLVLGRSGTGKTTVVAFKILLLDLLFMAYKKKFVHGNSSSILSDDDFNWMTG